MLASLFTGATIRQYPYPRSSSWLRRAAACHVQSDGSVLFMIQGERRCCEGMVVARMYCLRIGQQNESSCSAARFGALDFMCYPGLA